MVLKHVLQICKNIFACINSSYIYILTQHQHNYRIESDQSIVYIGNGKIDGTLIVVNASHNWVLYQVDNGQPIAIRMGVIVHNLEEQLVKVQFIDHRIWFMMHNNNIYQLYPNSSETHLIEHKPHPYSHGMFLINQFVPNNLNAQLIDFNAISNLNHQNMYSIYTANYTTQGILCGKLCIVDMEEQPIGIYDVDGIIIVVTQIQFINGGSRSYITEATNASADSAEEAVNITDASRSRTSKAGQLTFNHIQHHNLNETAGEVFMGQSAYYLLTSKYQFINLSNPHHYLLSNYITTITKAELKTTSTSNLLYVTKRIGNVDERLLVTSQLIATNCKTYLHGMMLDYSSVKLSFNNIIFLSSPIIGTMRLKYTMKGDTIQFISQHKTNTIDGEQSLWISQDYQLTSDKLIHLNNKTIIQLSNLFDNHCLFINHALILSNLLLLSINEQIHLFQLQNMNRLYIHCLNSEVIKLSCINQVNVFGCCVVDSLEMTICIINEENTIENIRSIYVGNDNIYGFESVINTMSYWLSIINHRLIVCSNEPLHRYQSSKITIQVYELEGDYKKICPIVCENNESTCQFILYGCGDIQIMSINKKYLIKSMDELTIHHECIVALPQHNNIILAIRKDNSLAIFNNTHIHLYTTNNTNKVIIQEQSYLERYIHQQQPNNLIILNRGQLNLMGQNRIISIDGSDNILIFNKYQLWYATMCYNTHNTVTIKLLSYFGMSNEAFTTFRNNLSLTQLNDPSFMKLFSDKLEIVDVKYIANDSIVVLLENMIVIVQIGYNSALAVKQQIKFIDHEDNLTIIELLDSYNLRSIYVKDSQSRLYVLRELNKDGLMIYELMFEQNLEDDVICVGRVKEWHNRGRTYKLRGKVEHKYERLVVKKDGQICIGDSSKITYL